MGNWASICLFDDNSYDEMQHALKQANALAENDKENHLIKILTGAKPPTPQDLDTPFTSAVLNASQQLAVNKILSANELAIVHGRLGTAKPPHWCKP